MRLGVLICVLLCVPAVAAGCGDDGGGSTGSATTSASTAAPTRAAFVAQGDALCRRANARIAATNERIAQINRTATSADRALAEAAPLLAATYAEQRRYVAEFRALTPPAGEEETIDGIVAGIEQQVGLVGQVADAAQAGDVARVRTLGASLKTTRTRVRGLLQGYGFQVCGRA